MTAPELFERLAPLIGPAIEEHWKKRDLCVLATRIALDVAEYFGVEARPVPVRAVVYNAAFAAHVDEGDLDVRKWEHDGSWSVGIGFGRDLAPGKWAGHLVAAADGVFADFSIRQAEREERGILTGTAVVGPLPAADTWTYENNAGTRIEYRRIEDEEYRTAPDWKDRARRKRVVGTLIRRVR